MSKSPSPRRKVRKGAPKRSAAKVRAKAATPVQGSKLDRIVAALRAPKGATIPDLMQLTGWQAHSVRGALSGALKTKRELAIVSEKRDGERIYRIKR